MSKRCNRVILTKEAKVLKEMRRFRKFSLRQVADMWSRSSSYLAQIECGRSAVPSGESLKQLLAIYGINCDRGFEAKVRNFQDKPTLRQQVYELLNKLQEMEAEVRQLSQMTKAMLAAETQEESC